MQALWDALVQLFDALLALVVSLGSLIVPWLPLLAWIAFWLFAVNWVKLRQILLRGGWVGLVLIGLMAIMVWGVVAPPVGDSHYLFGLRVSNFVGKTIYVTTLACIMLLCGAVQLSGLFAGCCDFTHFESPADDDHGHGDHGHGDHGHDAHGDHHAPAAVAHH